MQETDAKVQSVSSKSGNL